MNRIIFGNQKHQIHFLGFFSLTLSLISSCIGGFSNDFYWRPSLLQHRIEEVSGEFQMLWTQDSAFSLASDFESYITVFNNGIFLAGSLEENKKPSLMKLDLLTGEVQWEIPVFPTGFALSEGRLYVGEGLGRITSRSTETGEIIWEENIDGEKNFVYLIADNSVLHALSSTDNYYNINRDSGETNYFVRSTNVFFIDGNVSYLRSVSSVMTTKNSNGETLWQTDLRDPFSMKPVFSERLILLKTLQGSGPFGQIYALDRQNGNILWETSVGSVLSNVAVSNNVAFYLTNEAQLNAVEVQTGKMLGSVNFVPEISDNDIVNRRFSVAASNDVIVVYLGDSQQLFAFRFSLSK